MEEGKKRAPNFSSREKVLLLTIISDFKEIIESKKTNSQTWRNKDDAWQQIADHFNSETPENYPRSKDALRKYYDNIKKNLRKDIADEKVEIKKTGGGTYTVIADPVKELALGLVNPKTVFGLSNNDSDLTPDIPVIDVEEEGSDYESDHAGPHSFSEHNYSSKTETISHAATAIFTSPTSKVSVHDNTYESNASKENVSPAGKKKGKRGFVHVEAKQSEALKHVWTRRRRPAIQQLTSSKLSEEYLNLAKLKQGCYEEEKKGILQRNQHEADIFQLQKRKLLLEIAVLENASK